MRCEPGVPNHRDSIYYERRCSPFSDRVATYRVERPTRSVENSLDNRLVSRCEGLGLGIM